jgi:hypothetical protein
MKILRSGLLRGGERLEVGLGAMSLDFYLVMCQANDNMFLGRVPFS